jgi:hypothetical protein
MRLHIPLLVVTVATAGITLGTASPALSQTQPLRSPLTRLDTTVVVGWLNVNKSELSEYDNWYSTGAAGATVGWYWTDHLKTEAEYVVSSEVERDVYTFTQVGPLSINRESVFHFGTRRLAVGQHYQFLRNAMFHPYVAAGVDVNWESVEREDGEQRIFDTTGRESRIGAPAERFPKHTEIHYRPFAALGFKAYMSQRAYFRTDLKFVIDGGVEEVLTRFGVGFDF